MYLDAVVRHDAWMQQSMDMTGKNGLDDIKKEEDKKILWKILSPKVKDGEIRIRQGRIVLED